MRKIVTLLLAAIMVLGMCTGCGGDKPNGETTPSDGTVTLTIGIPQNANVTSYTDNAFTRYLEQEAGVKLKFQYFSGSASEYKQQLTLMASTNNEKLPDILWGFGGMGYYALNEFGQDGYLIDLRDLLKEHGKYYWEQFEKLTPREQNLIEAKGTDGVTGAFYGLPSYSCTAMDDLQGELYINRVWLDTLGLDIPQNITELRKVLEAFATQDPNGNGRNDEIPMLGPARGALDISTYIINAFLYYDCSNPFNATNGVVWDPVCTDEYRQALIYANKLCADGLLSDMCYTVTTFQDFVSLISPADGVAKVGIFSGHPAATTTADTDLLAEYVALPALADETGKGGYTVVHPRGLNFQAYITKDCADPVAAIKFLDLFYKDETITRMRHGELGVNWVYDNGINDYGEEGGLIRVLEDSAFFTGNATWCLLGPGILSHENYIAIRNEGTGRIAEISRLMGESWKIRVNAKQPAEVVNDLTYTVEEYEDRNDFAALYNSYVLESRNLFISGGMDPNDDAAWNEYLVTLKNMEQARLVEIAQAAYDRQK